MPHTEETVLDRERAAWLRRRLGMLSVGFALTFSMAFLATDRALFDPPSMAPWLHLPQAVLLCALWLWLRPVRTRRLVEWGTVVVWSLCFAWSSLWLLFVETPSVPHYGIGLLITVMFAAPVARLSARGAAVVLSVAAGTVLCAALWRFHGAPPLLFAKDALLVIPGVALIFDAASRDRLERAEFDARTRLQSANQSLQREETVRTRLFVNLSHDFRTPLTLIRGEADRLHTRPHSTDEADALLRIEANAAALADLVDQLLELARLDAGRTPRTPIDFPIGPVASEVAAQLRPATGTITITATDGEPPSLAHADPAHVRRILFNLVSNGARQLRQIGGEVRVETKRLGARVSVDVIDDGPGIAPERRARIFERFTSFDADGNTASGIGLPLARELAELNGGTLDLVDGAAKTTFRLLLPAAAQPRASASDRPAPAPVPVHVPAHASVSASARVPVSSPRSFPLAAAPPRRRGPPRDAGPPVPRARRSLRSGRSPVGGGGARRARVTDAARGGERRAPRRPHRLRSARNDPRPARPRRGPVLLVSALGDAAERVRGLTAGADDYLSKPFSTEELRARVAAAVDRADARQAALRAQRDAILMELHDGVNASLARAAILLSSQREGGEGDPRAAAQAAVREALDESTALLSVLESLHQPWEELAAELRRHLAETCERHDLELHFESRSDGTVAHVRPAAGHALRRIAREALTNVIKHSGAKRVECALLVAGGGVTLRLEDDGRGFAEGEPRGRGMGIIARRAEQLGGGAEFGNRSAGGAFVAARVVA